jgi:hypothetical protein
MITRGEFVGGRTPAWRIKRFISILGKLAARGKWRDAQNRAAIGNSEAIAHLEGVGDIKNSNLAIGHSEGEGTI